MAKLALILLFMAVGLLHCSMASPCDDSSTAIFEGDEDSEPSSFHDFNDNNDNEADMEEYDEDGDEDGDEDDANVEEYDEDDGEVVEALVLKRKPPVVTRCTRCIFNCMRNPKRCRVCRKICRIRSPSNEEEEALVQFSVTRCSRCLKSCRRIPFSERAPCLRICKLVCSRRRR